MNKLFIVIGIIVLAVIIFISTHKTESTPVELPDVLTATPVAK